MPANKANEIYTNVLPQKEKKNHYLKKNKEHLKKGNLSHGQGLEDST